LRGFLAYLAVAAGFIVLASGSNLFITPTQADYVRLTAIVSLFGFLTGFSPSVFKGLEERFSGKMHLDQKPDGRVVADVQGPAVVQVHSDPPPAAGRSDKPAKAVPVAVGSAPNGSAAPA
jgi:hypothetical protein